MEDKIHASVSRSRVVNMFGELSAANYVLMGNAIEQRDGHYYELMSCLIFAAFKHEAFINHLGFKIVPHWPDIERSSHHEKMELLLKKLGISIDKGSRPFQTLYDLFEARDQIAHGKPESLEQNNEMQTGTLEELRRTKPKTKWESICTVEFVKKAYDDTEKIADFLWTKADLDIVDLRARGHSYSIVPVEKK